MFWAEATHVVDFATILAFEGRELDRVVRWIQTRGARCNSLVI